MSKQGINMHSDLIPVAFHKIMQSKFYTLFILSALDKKFAIYTEAKVGQNIQSLLSEKPKKRPYTHDLMNDLFIGLEVHPIQAVIYDINDNIYYARLFLEQSIEEKKHFLEIETRPSDCLTIALMNDLPIFCKKEAFDKAVNIEEYD